MSNVKGNKQKLVEQEKVMKKGDGFQVIITIYHSYHLFLTQGIWKGHTMWHDIILME